MTDNEDKPAGMVTCGQTLGVRSLSGFANHGETIQENPCSGMTNTVQQSHHPHDGRRRRCEIMMRTKAGAWVVCAHAIYDGDCDLESFTVLDVVDDKRLALWIERYAAKIPNLDTMQTQREWPLQSPSMSWLLLRPGDIECV